MILCILGFALSFFMSLSKGNAASFSPDLEAALVRHAAAIDPLKDTKLRKIFPNAYVSPIGLQVHSQCFKYAKNNFGIERALAEPRLRAIAMRTYETISLCRARYPELSPYLLQATSQLRRGVVTCSKKNAKDMPFAAMALLGARQAPAYLVKEESTDLEKDLNLENGSYPRAYRPVIIYRPDSFAANIAGTPAAEDLGVQTLLHEILHTTDANNRTDHNDVERIAPSLDSPCAHDIGIDRINVIASLCTDQGFYFPYLPAQLYVYKRISACGLPYCSQVFTNSVPALPREIYNGFELPSRGLDLKSAQNLCSRIYKQGYCQATIRENGRELTRAGIPALSKIAAQVTSRINRLFPRGRAVIHQEVLNAFPQETALIIAATANKHGCFDQVLRWDADGSLAAVGADMEITPDLTPEQLTSRLLQTMILRTTGVPANASKACSIKEVNELVRALSSLNQALYQMFFSDIYTHLIKPRYLGGVEADYQPNFLGYRWKALRALIGESLHDEYMQALRRYHYLSPTFDCSTFEFL